jgi:hypothetical protein
MQDGANLATWLRRRSSALQYGVDLVAAALAGEAIQGKLGDEGRGRPGGGGGRPR